jgi:two-component system sensor histidine kinase BaeS
MHIAVEPEPAPELVLADPARLRQILDNLVGNAYHYTDQNGEITIGFHNTGGFVEIGVRDNGVGIALKDQPQIFDRFYRGDAPLVTATAGTGLGLSIVRYLVELHGGTIRIESTGLPGEGSTFLFTVPIYSKEESGRR